MPGPGGGGTISFVEGGTNNFPGVPVGSGSNNFDYGALFGYLTSVGEQNALDREFNSAEALAQRYWQERMYDEQMAFNSAEALKERIWSSEEAQKSRDWQTEMSNTSYQRAVSDLKSAGLNPILAAARSGGASTGSGGMATGGSAASVSSIQGSNASSSGSRGTDLPSLISAVSSLLSGSSDILKLFKGEIVSGSNSRDYESFSEGVSRSRR